VHYIPSADSLDDLMFDLVKKLLEIGDEVLASRGLNRELRGISFTLTDPRARVSRSASRGRLFSALGEFCWYLAGSDNLEHVEYYIANYRSMVETGSGAYGPRLFGEEQNAQVERVISQLRLHPTTRQALIQLFNLNDLDRHHDDVPCTSTLQFFDRDGRIDLVVYMRSNDVFHGLPHDIFAFTMLQEIVARALDRELGSYTHMVGSLHLYEENADEARAFIKEGALARAPMPSMPVGDPRDGIKHFMSHETALREGHGTSSAVDLADKDPEGYWRDLGDVLEAWNAYKTGDTSRLEALRDQLANTFYGLYLSDKHFDAEAKFNAQ